MILFYLSLVIRQELKDAGFYERRFASSIKATYLSFKGMLNLRFALSYVLTIFSCEKMMFYHISRKQIV